MITRLSNPGEHGIVPQRKYEMMYFLISITRTRCLQQVCSYTTSWSLSENFGLWCKFL